MFFNSLGKIGYMPWAPMWKKGIEKNEQNQNVAMNEMSYYKELYKLLNIAISVFKWENLPDGIDARQLELWLLTQGSVLFFYDEALKSDPKQRAPEGYAILPASLSGEMDLYNLPTDRRAFAANGYNKEFDDTNSVVIFNNQLRTPDMFVLSLYAQRIAEIDRTIDVNVMNQKAPKVIRCDDKQRLTFKNIAAQIIGNVYTLMLDKVVDLKDIDVIDLSVPFVGEDMDRLKRRYISEAMTYLGVEGVDTDKKERLIGQEVLRGMGDVEAMRFIRLTPRLEAAQMINDMFGLNVDVSFRSGLYIQTGDSHRALEHSSGMQTDLGNINQTTGYEV